ncbi:MAG: Eco57I restriction-modification methylase domain-containing protein [Candidatus Hodarchaeales archaeon]|jgi:tRNA1(Val) A37 N6-methylase TrmN6
MQQDPPDRIKELGQFFTPSYIALFIVQKTIGEYLQEISSSPDEDLYILDPSVGEGVFLVTAKDYLSSIWETQSEKISSYEEFDQKIVYNQLYGIDIDSNKVQMTREILGYPNYTDNIKIFDALLPNRNTSKSTKPSILRDWIRHFPKTEGKFHIIIGNPPWGADITKVKTKLRYLKSATSQMDTWSLFLERSILGLRDNGYLGFVVPNTLLTNPNYAMIREILLEKSQIVHLVNLGEDVFPGVTQPSMIVIIRKRKNNENHKIRIIPRISREEKQFLSNHQMVLDECAFFECPQSRFQRNPQKEFNIFAGSNTAMILLMEKDLYTDQKLVTKLSTLVINGRGVEIGRKGKVLKCPKCGMWNVPPRTERKCINPTCDYLVSPIDVHSEIVYDTPKNPTNDKPFLAGFQIQRYYTHKHRYINTLCQGINYKSPQVYQGPKLLVRKTGNSMNWVIDYQNRWVSQVVYIFKRREDLQPSLNDITDEYLLGVLNSQLMMKYIHSKFFDPERTDFPHFVQNSILNLPIRIPNTRPLKETAQKIGTLAKKLQDLYQELFQQSSDIKLKKELQGRIKSAEEEIENYISMMYSIPKDKSYLK